MYRVTFWEQPFPPPDVPLDLMGWGECTVDLDDVQDVHEAIEWAESNYLEYSPYEQMPVNQRTYVLFARVPGNEPRWIQVAGHDPTVPDSPYSENLDRPRALPTT